jgi:hypothetical protein
MERHDWRRQPWWMIHRDYPRSTGGAAWPQQRLYLRPEPQGQGALRGVAGEGAAPGAFIRGEWEAFWENEATVEEAVGR